MKKWLAVLLLWTCVGVSPVATSADVVGSGTVFFSGSNGEIPYGNTWQFSNVTDACDTFGSASTMCAWAQSYFGAAIGGLLPVMRVSRLPANTFAPATVWGADKYVTYVANPGGVAALQALSGIWSVTSDGYTWSGTANFGVTNDTVTSASSGGANVTLNWSGNNSNAIAASTVTVNCTPGGGQVLWNGTYPLTQSTLTSVTFTNVNNGTCTGGNVTFPAVTGAVDAANFFQVAINNPLPVEATITGSVAPVNIVATAAVDGSGIHINFTPIVRNIDDANSSVGGGVITIQWSGNNNAPAGTPTTAVVNCPTNSTWNAGGVAQSIASITSSHLTISNGTASGSCGSQGTVTFPIPTIQNGYYVCWNNPIHVGDASCNPSTSPDYLGQVTRGPLAYPAPNTAQWAGGFSNSEGLTYALNCVGNAPTVPGCPPEGPEWLETTATKNVTGYSAGGGSISLTWNALQTTPDPGTTITLNNVLSSTANINGTYYCLAAPVPTTTGCTVPSGFSSVFRSSTRPITSGTLTGTTATLNFATVYPKPYDGEVVTITGASPSGLNGKQTLTCVGSPVCNNTSMSFASTVTGTVGGTGNIAFPTGTVTINQQPVSVSGAVLTVDHVTSGTMFPGQYVTDGGIAGETYLGANLTGGSSDGSTWVLPTTQTIVGPATPFNLRPAPLDVNWTVNTNSNVTPNVKWGNFVLVTDSHTPYSTGQNLIAWPTGTIPTALGLTYLSTGDQGIPYTNGAINEVGNFVADPVLFLGNYLGANPNGPACVVAFSGPPTFHQTLYWASQANPFASCAPGLQNVIPVSSMLVPPAPATPASFSWESVMPGGWSFGSQSYTGIGEGTETRDCKFSAGPNGNTPGTYSLYCGIGAWEDPNPSPTAPGGQVIRMDSSGGSWADEFDLNQLCPATSSRLYQAVGALFSGSFTQATAVKSVTGVQGAGSVTLTWSGSLSAAPTGVIIVAGTSLWDGLQTITSSTPTTATFSNATTGTASGTVSVNYAITTVPYLFASPWELACTGQPKTLVNFEKYNGTGSWNTVTLNPSDSLDVQTRSYGMYTDTVTGQQLVFANSDPDGIYDGTFNAVTGSVAWSATVESGSGPTQCVSSCPGGPSALTNNSLGNGNPNRWMSMASCNGSLYATLYDALFVRTDGITPSWTRLAERASSPKLETGSSGYRGLSCQPDGNGNYVLLAWLEHNAGESYTFSSSNGWTPTPDINVTAYLSNLYDVTVGYVISAYNNITEYPQGGNPVIGGTACPDILVPYVALSATYAGAWGNGYPDAGYLVRHCGGASYDAHLIADLTLASGSFRPPLYATRGIVLSPATGNWAADTVHGTPCMYSFGYDGGNATPTTTSSPYWPHNTSWIERGCAAAYTP